MRRCLLRFLRGFMLCLVQIRARKRAQVSVRRILSARSSVSGPNIGPRPAVAIGLTIVEKILKSEIDLGPQLIVLGGTVPAGVEAFRLAREVLDEKGIKPPK